MNTLKHWKKKREMKILVISNWISTGWFYLLRCHSFVIIIYQYIKYSSKRTDIIANKKKGGNNNKIKKNQQMICSLSLSLSQMEPREREISPNLFLSLLSPLRLASPSAVSASLSLSIEHSQALRSFPLFILSS